jgi:serine/threonine protein kinase
MIEVHSCNLLHHDLQPRNIIFDLDHRPRICGFERCGHHAVNGLDVNYSAPEMNWSEAADVYSFAMIAYEIAVGQPVFSPQLSQYDVHSMWTEDERPRIPHYVAPFFRHLVRCAWTVIPDTRPSFEAIFQELTAHQFNLFEGVDCSEVAAFVDWVAACRLPRPVVEDVDEPELQLEEELDENISDAVRMSMEYHPPDDELDRIIREAECRLAPPTANVQEVIELLNDDQSLKIILGDLEGVDPDDPIFAELRKLPSSDNI